MQAPSSGVAPSNDAGDQTNIDPSSVAPSGPESRTIRFTDERPHGLATDGEETDAGHENDAELPVSDEAH